MFADNFKISSYVLLCVLLSLHLVDYCVACIIDLCFRVKFQFLRPSAGIRDFESVRVSFRLQSIIFILYSSLSFCVLYSGGQVVVGRSPPMIFNCKNIFRT